MVNNQAAPPINPYIVGAPIQGEAMFFGRDDIFEAVRAHLMGQHQDNPIVIYGQRRTGKTSVLYQMDRRLNAAAGAQRYAAVLIDVQGLSLDGMTEFLWSLARTIRGGLRREYYLRLSLPNRAAFETDARGAFRDTFLSSVSEELGDCRLLLMFDEAVRFEEAVTDEHLGRDVFDYLRSIIQHERGLSFIFSLGSKLERMRQEYALLFNAALYLPISFLDESDARAMVTDPVTAWYTFEPEALAHLLSGTSCHPYFTQLLCHALFAHWERERFTRVTIADVEAVQNEAVALAAANLQYIWGEASPTERCVLAGLAELPPDAATRQVLYQHLKKAGMNFQQGEVNRALEILVGREVLVSVKQPRFYIDLLRHWLLREKPLALEREALPGFSLAEHETRTGDFYRERAQYELARDAYQRALGEVPDHAPALLGMGLIGLAQRDLDSIITNFERVLEIDPGNPTARSALVRVYLSWAAQLLKAGRHAEARAKYEAVLALVPNNAKAHEGLAELEMQNRKQEVARLRDKAVLNVQYADWGTLEETATALLEWLPEDAEAQDWLKQARCQLELINWYEQGHEHLEMGAWQEAFEMFNRVIAIEPTYRDAADRVAEAVAHMRGRSSMSIPWSSILAGIGMLIIIVLVVLTTKPWSAVAPVPTSISSEPTFTVTPIPTFTPSPTETPMPTPTLDLSPPLEASLNDTWIRLSDDMVMLFVPAGTFWMGSDPEENPSVDSDELPQHEVILDAFWIDRTEVTNLQYEKCVTADVCNPSPYKDDTDFNGGNYPVVGVDWQDAMNYCVWAGAYLPTEAQWEYAARGPDNFIYPWGDVFDCAKGNFDDETKFDEYFIPDSLGCDGYLKTSPVGSYPQGDSWCGVSDMAGNVWEWVRDWYGSYDIEKKLNPTGLVSGTHRVIRGGAWDSELRLLNSSNRYRYEPEYWYFHLGFRCVIQTKAP